MPTTPHQRAIAIRWTGLNGIGQSGTWRIWAKAEGTWTLRGGLKPDVNALVVSAEMYAVLPTNKVNFVCAVELWEQDPTQPGTSPAVTMEALTLVDIEIERVGMTPGDSSPRALVYRLYFADHRHAWVEPRGGRLRLGYVNRADRPGTWANNQALANACIAAMGAATTAPSGMNNTEPLLDLDWRFAHAPSELDRLLQHTGYVYCPQPPTGAGNLQLAFWGTLPSYGSDVLVHDIATDAMDRRPSILVVTGGPTPVVRTYTEAASPAPSWKFVAQDPDDGFKWKPLANITQVGSDPLAAWRRDLPNATDEHREQLLDQVYRCIQLDPTRFPPQQCPLLPEAEGLDGSRKPASLFLEVALHADGGWKNVTARLPAAEVIPEHGVLVFEQPLVRVSPSPAGDEKVAAVAVPESQLKPTFSVEDWDATNQQRAIAVWGFNLSGGSPQPISESAALDYLDGYYPYVAVKVCPELRRVILNDATSNDAALADPAETYAVAELVESTSTAREMLLRGWHAVGISSRINQVSYDLARVTTTLVCDGWQLPRYRRKRGAA